MTSKTFVYVHSSRTRNKSKMFSIATKLCFTFPNDIFILVIRFHLRLHHLLLLLQGVVVLESQLRQNNQVLIGFQYLIKGIIFCALFLMIEFIKVLFFWFKGLSLYCKSHKISLKFSLFQTQDFNVFIWLNKVQKTWYFSQLNIIH